MKKIGVALTAVAAVVWGCSDASGPSLPNIAGLYDVLTVSGPATCTPPDTGNALSAVLESSVDTVHFGIRVDQHGQDLALTVVEVQGTPVTGATPIPATIDATGALAMSWTRDSDQVTIHYAAAPDRTFYFRTTAQAAGQFDLRASPLHAAISGGTVVVYREGNMSAPVFATCTTPELDAFSRVGA
jgi:hypothetical protein